MRLYHQTVAMIDGDIDLVKIKNMELFYPQFWIMIIIRIRIFYNQLRVWILIRLKKYRACINLLRQNIRWLEGLDNTRYYPFIAIFNIKMAQCYMALGYPSDAVGCCYLAVDNYTNDEDIEIRNKAISLRAKAFTAMALEFSSEKEELLQQASCDLACLKNLA